MKVCKVIGHVWATKKEEKLNGYKLMVVKNTLRKGKEEIFVAADLVGAGISDTVLITNGSSARFIDGHSTPVDAAIVGVVDALEIPEEEE